MPTCQFGFIYKGKQLCALEKDCALLNQDEYQTCEVIHRLFSKLTPKDIETLKLRLISKIDLNSPPKKS